MVGMEVINGGLKVAVIAPTIVFISLSLLAVVVSAMEKTLHLYDQIMESLFNLFRSKGEAGHSHRKALHIPQTKISVPPLSQEEKQAAYFLEIIAQYLGESFSLTKLETVAETRGMENCGELIRRLLDLEAVQESDIPGEEGLYQWKGTGE